MYCIIQFTTHNERKFSSTLWHCKAKSALQINPSNTNNSASAEPISKYWRKNNYNTFQSTQYNQRVLRPRSASNPTLSEITFTRVVSGVVSNHLSLFVSLFVSLLRSSERVYQWFSTFLVERNPNETFQRLEEFLCNNLIVLCQGGPTSALLWATF